LGAEAENARFETVEEWRCANIVSDLLVGIPDHADEELLGEPVRGTPVKMEVDSVLILRRSVTFAAALIDDRAQERAT
jgi:hypothetical protein